MRQLQLHATSSNAHLSTVPPLISQSLLTVHNLLYSYICFNLPIMATFPQGQWLLKVARYSFSGSIPPKFERKLRRHKQRFGKINTTVVLDKDENLL